MTNQELAQYLFPDIKDVSYYEEKYRDRTLEEGAIVTRFAPSPTGSVHMGSLYQAFMANQMAKQSHGVFFLRIEDTDHKREVENGAAAILRDLKDFDIVPSEGFSIGGEYGPYLQSERKEIYQSYIKSLIARGLAYPCFCSAEEMDEVRKIQEATKERIGYYGRWATCRSLDNDEIRKRIDAKEPYIIRLRSQGNFTKKHIYHDAIKGDVEYFENDMDIVIMKSDGLPTYHFAHAVDDHLMHTTHVIRGDEWLPSLPIHLELFQLLGFQAPQYAHIAPVMKLDEETGNIRKLSKRKDPEASVHYYQEMGIPVPAVKLYLATIGNTNFEEWYLEHPEQSIDDFTFTFDKMPVSGTLFDVSKLENIAKVYFSKRTAEQIYEETLAYSLQHDPSFALLLQKYQEKTIALLNIERGGDRPRKDIGAYPDVKKEFWYMYEELFDQKENPYQEVQKNYHVEDLEEYITTIYQKGKTQEEWFQDIKDFAAVHGYATSRKDYKANPEAYKGQVSDFCEMIRVMITTQTISPNLYDLMELMDSDTLQKRLQLFQKAL